jgi:uncharacterized protein DUF3592
MAGEVVGALFVLLVGQACMAGAAAILVRDHRRARTWNVADARIVGHAKARTQPGDHLRTRFKTIVEFTDAAGQTIRVRSSWSTAALPRVGRALRVCYPPGSPHKARIIGENRPFYVVAIGGAALAALACFWMVSLLRGQ